MKICDLSLLLRDTGKVLFVYAYYFRYNSLYDYVCCASKLRLPTLAFEVAGMVKAALETDLLLHCVVIILQV